MDPMNATLTMLNPNAPLVYVTPTVGTELRAATYMIVGALGAYLWDIFTNIYSDYRLLFEHKFTLPIFMYFFSRATVLASAVLWAVFRAVPLGLRKCQIFTIVTCVLYHTSFAATTFLFLLRVRAIFSSNKYIVAVFVVLWGAAQGGSLTVALTELSTVIGPTEYCMPSASDFKPVIAAAPVSLFVNDTCIFIAISWRLLAYYQRSPAEEDTREASTWKRFMFGHNLPTFPRSLLQDGQAYYLFSLVINLASVLIVIIPSVPLEYRFTYIFNSIIANMMACRVYRRTKFGEFREYSISTEATEIEMQNTSKLRGESQSTIEKEAKHRWYETRRSKFFFVLTMGCMLVVPVICVFWCVAP